MFRNKTEKQFLVAQTDEIIPTVENYILGTEKTSCLSLYLQFYNTKCQ